jgi:[acyl-carrier-protein] S-malonyltransferase
MVSGASAGIAFVFPGQASQKAGMAAELLEREPAARRLFQRAGEVLGLDLAELCTTGSDAALTRTDIAQPALLTTCVSWHEALRERGVAPQMVAGHSLGEFSAWVAAGVMGFEEALRLVRRRGELMEQVGDRRPGGMVAVIGLQDAQVAEICARASSVGVVVVANHNSPGQVVVSGEPVALDRMLEEVKAARGRAIPLRVSGAFHSPLMEDAACSFADLVARLPLEAPQVPVIVNSTAEPVTDADAARQAMSRQMTSPVLWTESVRRMARDGARIFIEVGPGQVLSKLIERISGDARALPAGSPADLAAALQALAG